MMIGTSDLDARLSDAIGRHNVPGASVSVFHAGELTTATAGVTNINTGVPVTADTVMHVGSITKIFNATLVMQLVDEEQIALDDPIVKYLPDLRLKDRAALGEITVRMLLNHSSGIDGEMLPNQGHDEETIEKGIGRLAAAGQIHRPGKDFSYCNAATVIAGYLVQRLRKKSWYELMRERIFTPLGIEHAATLPEEALLHRASVGHFVDAGTSERTLKRTSFAFLPLSFAPCGTTLMISSPDLMRFVRAHMADGVGENGTRILSARSTRAMREITMNNRGKGYTFADGIGIGWFLTESGWAHHLGGGPGIVSAMYAHPEQQFAIALFTNAAQGLDLINEMVSPWLEALGGGIKPFGPVDVRVPEKSISVQARRYVGVYEDVMNRFTVTQAADGLRLSKQAKFACYEYIPTEASAPERLIPLGDEQFLLEMKAAPSAPPDAFRIFTFRNPDGEGRMRHLGNCLRLYPKTV